jgi:hypothetical protein
LPFSFSLPRRAVFPFAPAFVSRFPQYTLKKTLRAAARPLTHRRAVFSSSPFFSSRRRHAKITHTHTRAKLRPGQIFPRTLAAGPCRPNDWPSLSLSCPPPCALFLFLFLTNEDGPPALSIFLFFLFWVSLPKKHTDTHTKQKMEMGALSLSITITRSRGRRDSAGRADALARRFPDPIKTTQTRFFPPPPLSSPEREDGKTHTHTKGASCSRSRRCRPRLQNNKNKTNRNPTEPCEFGTSCCLPCPTQSARSWKPYAASCDAPPSPLFFPFFSRPLETTHTKKEKHRARGRKRQHAPSSEPRPPFPSPPEGVKSFVRAPARCTPPI